MASYDAKKQANDRWDRANRTMMGCKMYRDKAESFKRACYANGTTPNAVFTAAVEDFMAAHGGWAQWGGGGRG